MTFLTSILLGCAWAGGAVFSIRFGRRDEAGLRESARPSFVLIAGLTVALNLAAFLCLDGIRLLLSGLRRSHLGADAGVPAVIFWGIAATFLYNYFACYLRAIGDSVTPCSSWRSPQC